MIGTEQPNSFSAHHAFSCHTMLPSHRCERAGSDEIITLLEDVGLNLQSMLSSRYVQPFVEEVRPRGQEQRCTVDPFSSVIMYEQVHLLPVVSDLAWLGCRCAPGSCGWAGSEKRWPPGWRSSAAGCTWRPSSRAATTYVSSWLR